ncbi:MAG: sulfur reduction protein DsrE [Chloroflexi bacterium]|nr:sulfur reduction protein DsrE [Chloroflexota bacterium]
MDEDRVLIIMTSGINTPRRCATPFFFASLAVAMDLEVDMFFTIDGTSLLKKGVAETVYPKEGGAPVSDFLNDAIESGVTFYCCTASLELNDMTPDDLIDGVELVGGATMWELAEDASKILSF